MRAEAVSEEEAKWRRRSDARTLAEAEEIKADKRRYSEAIKGANEIYAEEVNRVKGLKKIVGKQPMSGKSNNPATLGRL